MEKWKSARERQRGRLVVRNRWLYCALDGSWEEQQGWMHAALSLGVYITGRWKTFWAERKSG